MSVTNNSSVAEKNAPKKIPKKRKKILPKTKVKRGKIKILKNKMKKNPPLQTKI